MKAGVTIVKIGGNVIDDEVHLRDFLDLFAVIDGPRILVHGGGKLATQWSERLGIITRMVGGRRITDEATLQVVTMTYAGWINKKIVSLLQSAGCNAIGLSGADAQLIPAVKRPVNDIDYGWVGDIRKDGVNAGLLRQLLQQGYTPVLAPITCDEKGNLLNVNADTIAQSVAEALVKDFSVALIYCFERNGVLRHIEDEQSLMTEIKISEVEGYKQNGWITDGMLPKIDNAVEAVNRGVEKVVIGKAAHIGRITKGEKGYGTFICR